MKIGILSKRTGFITGKLKNYFENDGHEVKIYTKENLCINPSLFENDLYILKSKSLFFQYAGLYLEKHGIPVIPNLEITRRHKNRIEADLLIKEAGLLSPEFYYGTVEAIKKSLDETRFPLILKPLSGSGSKGVRIVNSANDLKESNSQVIYLQKFIKGIHLNVYFIGDEICALEKPPMSNEHTEMKLLPLTDDIKGVISNWVNTHNILFGHLDIVRERSTNKLYVIDPGSFPVFDNWKCGGDPVDKICRIIIKKYYEIAYSKGKG